MPPRVLASGPKPCGAIIKCPFKYLKWPISLPFNLPQLVKSLPFHIPEAWKRYPFRAEPPRIGHYREYPPGADKLAATCSDKGSYFTQHEFEEVVFCGSVHQGWSYRPKNKLYCFLDPVYYHSYPAARIQGSITALGVSVSLESVVVAWFPASLLIPGGTCPGYLFPLFVSLGISNVVFAYS